MEVLSPTVEPLLSTMDGHSISIPPEVLPLPMSRVSLSKINCDLHEVSARSQSFGTRVRLQKHVFKNGEIKLVYMCLIYLSSDFCVEFSTGK